MGNVIALFIIIIILTVAISKIVKEKKSGTKCIGCPHGKGCSSKCDSNIKNKL